MSTISIPRKLVRPCTCGRVTGDRYTPDQCYLCWLVERHAHFAERWSLPNDKAVRVENEWTALARSDKRACDYRGEKVRGINCGCSTPLAVFRCDAPENDRHECTLMAQTASLKEEGVPFCDGCPFRKIPAHLLPRPNPTVPKLSVTPECPIQPAWMKILDFSRVSSGRSHINGGVLRYREKLILIYRKNWGNSDIHLAELDENYSPIRDVQLPIRKLTNKNRYGDEDPRPFIFNDQLWFIANGFAGWSNPTVTSIQVARVELDGALPEHYWLDYPRRRQMEKNWGPFECEGRLKAVYQADPRHIVVSLFPDATSKRSVVDTCEASGISIPQLGLIRGGAPPILHNGEYYSFCHTCYNKDRETSRSNNYTQGLYTFSNREPHKPLRYLPFPLIAPDGDGNYASLGGNKRVVFPCAAFFENGQWVISGGWCDQQIFAAKFDAAEIERNLLPCN